MWFSSNSQSANSGINQIVANNQNITTMQQQTTERSRTNSGGENVSSSSTAPLATGGGSTSGRMANLSPISDKNNNNTQQTKTNTSQVHNQVSTNHQIQMMSNNNYQPQNHPHHHHHHHQIPNDLPEKISFHLKTSIFTRRVTIDSDKMALGLIKQLAIAFLNELYFRMQLPPDTYIGDYIRKHFSSCENLGALYDRLVLRKYNLRDESFLPFNSVSDIEPESYISIEVSEKPVTTSNYNSNNNNNLQQLMSSSSTALSSLSPNNHYYHHHQQQQHSGSNNNSSHLQHSGTQQQVVVTSQVKMSHEFKLETLFMPTHCASCTSLIGAFRQAYQCVSCKKNFCPKCKLKAETSGDSCLIPNTINQPSNSSSSISSQQQAVSQHQTTSQQQQHQSSNLDSGQQQGNGSENSAEFSKNGSSGNINAANNKLEAAHLNMSKRKSASNLLHFNIANPFKSHHAQQQPQSTSGQQQQQQVNTKDNERPKVRGSTGALDPVLGKLREQLPPLLATKQPSNSNSNKNSGDNCPLNMPQSAATTSTSNLLVAQSAQISSSHQNLFTDMRRDFVVPTSYTTTTTTTNNNNKTDEVLAGSLSVHQSPINSSNKAHVNQLSNSARTSAHDLHAAAHSPTGKMRDHQFISMDWIQINGEPLCGVCSKLLKSQQLNSLASNQSPVMCKNCKLQVHVHCQDLVLNDCLSRIAESSRAAAERQASNSTSPPEEKTGVMNTNSNASRDNIRLRRLVPSVKHVKRPDSTKPIIEGWLKHTTLSDEQARQHYWRLDETDITLYENDTSRRYFKAIALNKITRVMSNQSIPKRVKEDVLTTRIPELAAQILPQVAASPGERQQQTTKSANTSPLKSPQLQAQMKAMFGFELASGSMYLVQANSEIEASKWHESLAAITAQKQQQKQPEVVGSTPVAPTTVPIQAANSGSSKSTKQQEQPETVKKLVEFVNTLCIDKERDLNAPTTPTAAVSVQKPIVTELSEQKLADSSQILKPETNNNKQVAPVLQPQPQPQQQQQHQLKEAAIQGTATTAAANNSRQVNLQQRQHHHHYLPSSGRHSTNKTYTDPSRSRLYNRPRITIQINPMSIPDHWIVGKYLIERDRIKKCGFEELGSGQFGKVYAAISEIKPEDPTRGIWSGVPVAIKEISKARFDLRQQAKLKNEANILSQLDHPGVIILERVHDLPDKIYIVMEQLEDDMLEMIVSTDEKRLNERITKFLTYQILEALKYLHQKHIAHCDLKPENVLLVERRSQFPQIKLCDFGFAKIIEDNSFRSSLVGTPAYLAPEVVKGERYNRSVDLWSVGVIVYVSLSGEFPFNEGESIHDQISRANFMYPKIPWDGISTQAKNFINSLLRVNCEKRLSASRAQMDDWIQDYQLWCDLTELEVRVGRRWVTDDADFERWSRYAREHSLQLPRSAVQLHENLLAD